jgi:putative peptidoglycan lipid II flippase
MVYAAFMGDGAVSSAFKFAFMVPNLFRRLLGEGALTAAFIPIFKSKEKTEGEIEMWRAANAVISGAVVAACVITGLATIGITLALSVYRFNENTALMLSLLRVMFPYMPVICLTALFMGMLNARGQFFVPALGAAALNIGMIASVFFLAPLFGTSKSEQIYGVAFGVLLAGVAQAAFQLPNLYKQGFRFQWINPRNNPTVREVLKKMIPGTLGVAAFQINLVITNLVAFQIDENIVASYDYAVRLMELPQGVFGISLATYLLPTLAGMAAEKKYPEFRQTLSQAMGYLIFINLVASVLLTVLAEPIIRLLFERGNFDQFSTQRASSALRLLAPGLVLFSLVNILARAFFALGDTATPMRITVFCMVLNLALALLLVFRHRQAGIALASTVTAGFNVGLLLYALRKKLKFLEVGALKQQILPLISGLVVATLLAWSIHYYWDQWIGHRTLWMRIGEVFAPGIVAFLGYFGVGYFLKHPAANDLLHLAAGFKEKLFRQKG